MFAEPVGLAKGKNNSKFHNVCSWTHVSAGGVRWPLVIQEHSVAPYCPWVQVKQTLLVLLSSLPPLALCPPFLIWIFESGGFPTCGTSTTLRNTFYMTWYAHMCTHKYEVKSFMNKTDLY